MAGMARLASQPYPAAAQRTRAWLDGLEDEPQVGGLNPIEASSTAPQENANPAFVADRMEEEHDGEQSALAEKVSLEIDDPSIGNIPMQDTWESATVASTMHTASMYDWNGDGESEPTMPPLKEVEQDLSLHGYKQDGGHDDTGSVYAPSSRSVTPPPRESPRKRKRHATRRAVLDEDYDGEKIGPTINGGAWGQDVLADELYLPSSTAVQCKDHSLS
jgi:hypothetical protein